MLQRIARRSGPSGSRVEAARRGLLIGLLAIALLSGCTSFRGARAYQRGSAAMDRGEATVAAEELETAAALLPHASEIQNHLGIAYWMEGREAEALVAFRRAVELDCDNQAAARNLAEAEALYARPPAPLGDAQTLR